MRAGALQVLGGGAILAFLVVTFTPAVNALNFWMMPRRPLEPAQAIVVLGAGGVAASGGLTDTSLRGTMAGISLYQRGLAPVVVFSGSPEGSPRDEARVLAEVARSCGIPAASIVVSSRAHTTREEAREIHALLAARGIHKIMLVADTPGMARAVRVFERVGFDVVPAPWAATPDGSAFPEDRFSLVRQLAMEAVARLYYRAAGYL